MFRHFLPIYLSLYFKNLDKDFIGLSLLDLIYLEYIVYAMQLKEYGVDNKSIQRAINDLFGCLLAL